MPQILPLVAIASGQILTIWNPCSEDAFASRKIISSDSILSISWNHNGLVFAVCSKSSCDVKDNCVSLVSVLNGEKLNSLGKEELKGCQHVRFAAKSRLLCCTCNDMENNFFISVWDLKRMNEVRRFDDSRHPLLMSCLDSSDTFVYSLSEKTFSIYRLKEAQKVGEIVGDNVPGMKHTCFDSIHSLGRNLVAIGDSYGRVRLYDLETVSKGSAEVQSKPQFEMRPHEINKQANSEVGNSKILQVSFFNESLAVLQPNHLTIYNWLNQSIRVDVNIDNNSAGFNASCFCWNGSIIALGFESGYVILLDWKTHRQLAEYRIPHDDFCNNQLSIDCLLFSRQEIETDPTKHVSPSNTVPKNLAFAVVQEVNQNGVSKQVSHALPSDNLQQKDEFLLHQTTLNGVKGVEQIATFEQDSAHTIRHNSDPEQVAGPGDNGDRNISGRKMNGDCGSDCLTTVVEEQKLLLQTSLAQAEQRISNALHNEITEAFTSMHVGMIKQFQIQSEEINHALSKQLDVLERIADENHELRLENSRLRELLKQFRGGI